MAKMVVSLSVVPLGTATPSLSKYVARVTEVIKTSGFRYRTGAGFTDVELDSYQQLASLLEKIEKTLTDMGVQRISITIKIDRRLDKELHIEEKIAKAEGL
ncbi:MTH1187 family thiamine-binding protein [Pyrobaculum sp. 3827-6]|uniref:MTH1187 family thiamine-binding protein n=1 Tax=Pyrobaculum sp. 3827-6 TaxID=2983604 RepID=UPI0021DA86EC|nr:MTH1187 family thiamine-binding protein [Pyrobaculum sp. 3827-6]MCU7788587.1 MTH1187 family thiamine-binding protein [Pyrobaculum sp. 3827-6]